MVTDFASKLQWLRDYLLAGDRQSVVVTCVSCDQEMEELTRVNSLPHNAHSCYWQLVSFYLLWAVKQYLLFHECLFRQYPSAYVHLSIIPLILLYMSQSVRKVRV